jgi:hypothetical protein
MTPVSSFSATAMTPGQNAARKSLFFPLFRRARTRDQLVGRGGDDGVTAFTRRPATGLLIHRIFSIALSQCGQSTQRVLNARPGSCPGERKSFFEDGVRARRKNQILTSALHLV